MRIPRVWIDEALADGETYELPRATAHHLIHVLRMQVGDALIAFDGHSGEEAQATLASVRKQGATILIGQSTPVDRESPLRLSLVQAISKGEKMDFTIQKAVELGATEIIPIYSERSVPRFKADRLQKRLEHWRQVIISASEQSGRTQLTRLTSPTTFNAFCDAGYNQAENALLLAPEAKATLTTFSYTGSGGIQLWIGPEGGFSEPEIQRATTAGVNPVSAGPRILRTETAGLAALAVLQSAYGDW